MLVNPVSRKPESPIQVPEKQSAFHPRAQRNAFRHRDVGLQSRSFARWNQSLRHSPQHPPALLRLSAIISQYFTRFAPGIYHVAFCSAFKEPFQRGLGKQQVAILSKYQAQAAWADP
jgi:hypothetical protein